MKTLTEKYKAALLQLAEYSENDLFGKESEYSISEELEKINNKGDKPYEKHN